MAQMYGFLAEVDSLVKDYVDDTHRRLQVEDLVKNPFEGYAHHVKVGDKLLVIISIKHIYPNILFHGFIGRLFYKAMFRRGLKKVGYVGKLKLVSDKFIAKSLGGLLWGKTI
jgi:hypothetical protein